jgi:hypothetical protein
MPLLSTTRKRVVATVSALAVAGGATAFVLTAGAVASASPTVSTPSTTTGAKATLHPDARAHGLLRHSDYATVEVRRKGHWVTYVLNRGKVTAVSSGDITLKRPDGATVTIALAPTTKYRGVSGESALKTGRRANVLSTNGTALRVGQALHPKATQPASA